jgi:hypothetical protein
VTLRWIERIAIVLASLALAIVLIVLLSGYFTAHDQGTIAPAHTRTAAEGSTR